MSKPPEQIETDIAEFLVLGGVRVRDLLTGLTWQEAVAQRARVWWAL
jgi:hypothetical protein